MAEKNAKYWEAETPEVIYTDSNVFRYYPMAKRLQVCLPDYCSASTGERHMGKGVGLALDMLTPEAKQRLVDIISQ